MHLPAIHSFIRSKHALNLSDKIPNKNANYKIQKNGVVSDTSIHAFNILIPYQDKYIKIYSLVSTLWMEPGGDPEL